MSPFTSGSYTLTGIAAYDIFSDFSFIISSNGLRLSWRFPIRILLW